MTANLKLHIFGQTVAHAANIGLNEMAREAISLKFLFVILV
jgi:hypothetical protein